MLKLIHLGCLASFAAANTGVIVEEVKKPAPLRSNAKLAVGISSVALAVTSLALSFRVVTQNN
ncbi:hypothetical protein D9M71_835960 [compost metagenome]